MKTNRKILAGLILATGIGGAGMVIAQPGMGMKGGCDGMGQGKMGRHVAMQYGPEQRAERQTRHLEALKAELKITATQEPLWQAFAEKMQAKSGKGMQSMRDTAGAKLSAPERMAKMQSVMEEHLAAMKGVHESFGRLYAALTPEQQAVADQHAARMGKGGPRRGAAPQG
jgi:periplasmic protein CpxP/Spy